MEFKKEQIGYLAELAKLHIDSKEIPQLYKQLKDILNYIGELSVITDLPDTAKFRDQVKTVNVWRDDIVKPLPEIGRQAILKNAPDIQDDLIKTKPVFPLASPAMQSVVGKAGRNFQLPIKQ